MDDSHFGTGISIWYPLLKKCQLHPTFEKVLQLGPFQTELTNVVSQCATCQSVVFLFFILFFKKNFEIFDFFFIFWKKIIKMSRVRSLCVPRGIVSATWHCNAMCQCHYQMSLCWFRFSPYICLLVSIWYPLMCIWFNFVPIFLIRKLFL